MSATEYLLGAAFLIFVCGAAGVAGAIVVARVAARESLLARVLAWGLLTALFVFAAHVLPGLFGVLDRVTVAVAAALILALVLAFVPDAETGAGAADPPAPPSGMGSIWIALAGALAVGAYLLANLIGQANDVVLQQDVTSFHLPNIARWIESGSFWQVDDFIPGRAPGNYPQTGDVFLLAAILPWESDFLARYVGVPFLGLTGLGVYGLARELSAVRATAVLVAAATIAMPVVGYVGVQGFADAEMIGTFAAGGYFLLRHWRTGAPFDLALAAIGLGLSFGTRWYAVPAVGAAVLVWLVARHAAGRPWAALRRDGWVLVGGVALCGGFWLLRNLVESGNPVFPVRVAPFDLTIFDAPRDVFRESQGFTLAGYLGSPDVWVDYLWESFLDFLSWVSVGIWVALAIGLVAGIAMRDGSRSGSAHRVLALVAVAALIGVAYAITPYSATGLEGEPRFAWVNARYVVPALIAGAAVAAWLISISGRARRPLELLALVALADALRRAADFPGGGVSLPHLVVAAVVVAASIGLTLRWRRAARRPGPRPSPVALARAAVAVALLGLVLGRAVQSGYEDNRYAGLDRVVDFVGKRASEDRRIGFIGDGFGLYWLFGPELDNEVEPIARRVEEMLRSYRKPHEFVTAVRRGDYDLVLAQELDSLAPALPRRQQRWLRNLGFEPLVEGKNPGFGYRIRLWAPPNSPYLERRR